MKVVAFNGSPRIGGNTEHLINHTLEQIQENGIDTELVHLGDKNIRSCTACFECMKNKDKKCIIKNDPVNDYIKKIDESDGIILGSPVYFGNLTASLKAFIERAGLVSKANDELYRHKIGAAVVAVRRNGALQTFNSINSFFLIGQMIVVGSNYCNTGKGIHPGDVEKDSEAIITMQNIGKNLAWIIAALGNAKSTSPDFIRVSCPAKLND